MVKVGDVVKYKNEWLAPGEMVHPLVVLEAWDDRDGILVQALDARNPIPCINRVSKETVEPWTGNDWDIVSE